MSRLVRRCARLTASLVVALALAWTVGPVSGATAATSAPAGLTAIALDGAVGLAWQPVPGATAYSVYRGTAESAIDEQLTLGGVGAASFVDRAVANGQRYFYGVIATGPGGTSPRSQVAEATPRARACSSASAVVAENC